MPDRTYHGRQNGKPTNTAPPLPWRMALHPAVRPITASIARFLGTDQHEENELSVGGSGSLRPRSPGMLRLRRNRHGCAARGDPAGDAPPLSAVRGGSVEVPSQQGRSNPGQILGPAPRSRHRESGLGSSRRRGDRSRLLLLYLVQVVGQHRQGELDRLAGYQPGAPLEHAEGLELQ